MKKHDSWNYLSLRLEQTQKELLQDLVYFAVQPAGKRGGIARFSCSILRGFFADKLRGQLGGEVPEELQNMVDITSYAEDELALILPTNHSFCLWVKKVR